jgi:hypothetical protein
LGESRLFFPIELVEEEYSLSTSGSEGGSITTPDHSTTRNMIKTQKRISKATKEWIEFYDYHYGELQIDINPNNNYNPNQVSIVGTLNHNAPVLKRPNVTDVFPKTEFVDSNWSVQGSFVASASAGFQTEDIFGSKLAANIEGELEVRFNYNPKIAKIDSGTGGSTFHWNFREANAIKPIGGLRIMMIIQRPRSVKELKILWEVEVKYGKKYYGADYGRHSSETELEFTESQIA